MEEPDERGEEDHEQYEHSQEGSNEQTTELYDPNDVREIKVNCKNKASSLKKIILDSIKLYKRACISLYKQVTVSDPESKHLVSKQWVAFDDTDYNTSLKEMANHTIAFRVSFNITVSIEGRG